MHQKHFSGLLLWAIGCTLVAAGWTTYGCAGIGQPTGGPKDTLAPILLKSVPENFTKSFQSNTVVFNFDEYVDLDDVSAKLLVNPPLDRFPLVDRKLRTVTMRIKDTLSPNTTYSFRFDGIIRDVNEANPQGDFTYVLTTGTYFDTAQVGGTVLDAQTGKVDSTLIVLLHSNPSDTAVIKEKPRYVTRLNGKGQFLFEYVAPGTYQIFALKDQGFKRYSDSTIPFAFLDSSIRISTNTNPVDLYFFQKEAVEEPKEAPPATTTGADRRRNREADEEAPKLLRYQPSASKDQPLNIFDSLSIKFASPLKSFDSTLISLTDTLFRPLGNFSLHITDTTQTRVNLAHPWKLETHYLLILQKGFATDTSGITTNKNDTVRFVTKSERDYGAIKMTFVGLDFTKNPVLQWIQGSKIVRSMAMSGPVYAEKLFIPGDYEINILLDANKNGKWDTGDYPTKKQPERTLEIPKKINVRVNWDNEFEINMDAPPEVPVLPGNREP
jgi:hypothetical protein